MSSIINLSLVRKRMTQLRLSTKQIAQYVVQSDNVVKEWLSGARPIPYKYYLMIADLLGIDLSDILQGTTTRRKK